MFENFPKIIQKELNDIREYVKKHSVGVANVYNEIEKVRDQLNAMKSFQDRMKGENLPIDEVELKLRIKSYPMNIRIYINIETNFGEISSAFDYPPILENKLSEILDSNYFRLLNELYDEHEKRGGLFMGDKGCKDWMDKNGRTIILKEPTFSPRFSK